MSEQTKDFMAWLESNGMSFQDSQVSYKGKCVCFMHIGDGEEMPDPWTIWSDGDYSRECDTYPMSERMKEIAWANVNICANCGGSCSPGKRKTIFGKAFDNVCNADMAFHKPNAETLDCVKKLLLIRKNDIDSD